MPIIQDVHDGPAESGPPAPGPAADRRPRRAVGTAALLLTVALGVGVAACSGSDSGPIASDVPGADRTELREGGTLRWAVNAVPATLNVFQTGTDATSALVAQAALPTLFRLDDRARATLDPDFLVSADSTAPAAGHPQQTVVYRLNPKAVWSDGTPISAADFAAQWKALSGTDSAYWSTPAAGYSAIASVTQGADAHHVKVVFKQPCAHWKGLFTPLYPASATKSAEAFNTGSKDGLAVSAGPFKVARVDRSAGSVTLVRNPAWWGDRARLDRIDLVAVPVGKRLEALGQGRLDIAALDRAVDDPAGVVPAATAAPAADSADAAGAVYRSAEALPGFQLRKAAGAAYTQLTLNGGRGPLADPRVRRAVARAVDRQHIADAVLKPFGLPAVTLGNHLLLADQDGYQDNTAALGRTDREAAAELLEAAGWKVGGAITTPAPDTSASRSAGASPGPSAGPSAHASAGPSASASASASASESESASAVPAAATAATPAPAPVPVPAGTRARGGKPLTLDLLIPSGSTTARRIARAVSADLARVGIVAVPRAVDGAGFFADHIAAGDFDLAVFSWPGSPNTVADERPLYAKPQPGPDGLPVVGLNYARTGTDEIDRLLDEAAAALDPEEAARLTQQADVRIWEEAHSLPLFQRPELVAVRDSVAGVGAFGFATPRFQDMGFRLTS
ncbi:ABC transporter family substrate-binding protein [Peterkaempfera bronchialis]|uniref:ABC transporter family substrate-binding protein n=1 Tax=Peterkaempfera bronchialis TaxID=2126346 RepID=UPI00158C7A17|nr:ABC transporter family substrate-binding protein [Peterkaempfera bronchialis]